MIKQILSPNFAKGRKGYTPELIVVHIMDGSLLGTDEWFSNPASQVSSHYGIGLDGEIHQYVLEENTAWTEGNIRQPSAKYFNILRGINPNLYSLSIENEGHDLQYAPETQLNALVGLIKQLSDKYHIAVDRDHILGHFEIDSVVKGNCPSPDHNIMDTIVKKVELLTNQNKNMIKWIKCYTTGSDIVNTYNVADNAVESVGETHSFSSAADAQAKSTSQVLIVWDAQLVGVGALTE